jgi:hypothetical protein
VLPHRAPSLGRSSSTQSRLGVSISCAHRPLLLLWQHRQALPCMWPHSRHVVFLLMTNPTPPPCPKRLSLLPSCLSLCCAVGVAPTRLPKACSCGQQGDCRRLPVEAVVATQSPATQTVNGRALTVLLLSLAFFFHPSHPSPPNSRLPRLTSHLPTPIACSRRSDRAWRLCSRREPASVGSCSNGGIGLLASQQRIC